MSYFSKSRNAIYSNYRKVASNELSLSKMNNSCDRSVGDEVSHAGASSIGYEPSAGRNGIRWNLSAIGTQGIHYGCSIEVNKANAQCNEVVTKDSSHTGDIVMVYAAICQAVKELRRSDGKDTNNAYMPLKELRNSILAVGERWNRLSSGTSSDRITSTEYWNDISERACKLYKASVSMVYAETEPWLDAHSGAVLAYVMVEMRHTEEEAPCNRKLIRKQRKRTSAMSEMYIHVNPSRIPALPKAWENDKKAALQTIACKSIRPGGTGSKESSIIIALLQNEIGTTLADTDCYNSKGLDSTDIPLDEKGNIIELSEPTCVGVTLASFYGNNKDRTYNKETHSIACHIEECLARDGIKARMVRTKVIELRPKPVQHRGKKEEHAEELPVIQDKDGEPISDKQRRAECIPIMEGKSKRVELIHLKSNGAIALGKEEYTKNNTKAALVARPELLEESNKLHGSIGASPITSDDALTVLYKLRIRIQVVGEGMEKLLVCIEALRGKGLYLYSLDIVQDYMGVTNGATSSFQDSRFPMGAYWSPSGSRQITGAEVTTFVRDQAPSLRMSSEDGALVHARSKVYNQYMYMMTRGKRGMVTNGMAEMYAYEAEWMRDIYESPRVQKHGSTRVKTCIAALGVPIGTKDIGEILKGMHTIEGASMRSVPIEGQHKCMSELVYGSAGVRVIADESNKVLYTAWYGGCSKTRVVGVTSSCAVGASDQQWAKFRDDMISATSIEGMPTRVAHIRFTTTPSQVLRGKRMGCINSVKGVCIEYESRMRSVAGPTHLCPMDRDMTDASIPPGRHLNTWMAPVDVLLDKEVSTLWFSTRSMGEAYAQVYPMQAFRERCPMTGCIRDSPKDARKYITDTEEDLWEYNEHQDEQGMIQVSEKIASGGLEDRKYAILEEEIYKALLDKQAEAHDRTTDECTTPQEGEVIAIQLLTGVRNVAFAVSSSMGKYKVTAQSLGKAAIMLDTKVGSPLVTIHGEVQWWHQEAYTPFTIIKDQVTEPAKPLKAAMREDPKCTEGAAKEHKCMPGVYRATPDEGRKAEVLEEQLRKALKEVGQQPVVVAQCNEGTGGALVSAVVDAECLYNEEMHREGVPPKAKEQGISAAQAAYAQPTIRKEAKTEEQSPPVGTILVKEQGIPALQAATVQSVIRKEKDIASPYAKPVIGNEMNTAQSSLVAHIPQAKEQVVSQSQVPCKKPVMGKESEPTVLEPQVCRQQLKEQVGSQQLKEQVIAVSQVLHVQAEMRKGMDPSVHSPPVCEPQVKLSAPSVGGLREKVTKEDAQVSSRERLEEQAKVTVGQAMPMLCIEDENQGRPIQKKNTTSIDELVGGQILTVSCIRKSTFRGNERAILFLLPTEPQPLIVVGSRWQGCIYTSSFSEKVLLPKLDEWKATPRAALRLRLCGHKTTPTKHSEMDVELLA